MVHTCPHCSRIFSTASSLTRHKNTAKFCLKIQEEKGEDIQVTTYECPDCDYSSGNSWETMVVVVSDDDSNCEHCYPHHCGCHR